MTFHIDRLDAALREADLSASALAVSHPCLFSASSLAVSAQDAERIGSLISAIESVISLPAYQARVLASAPKIARRAVKPHGVFFGYDFHLTAQGPRLIEINTNAGGALLNTCLLKAHGELERAGRIEQDIVRMFLAEWQLQRGNVPLRSVAIVDDEPAAQYLYPEFLLFQRLFEQHGIRALILAPTQLKAVDDALEYDGQPIDLVYLRLTDFALEAAVSSDLKRVFQAGGVVMTPHPRLHALYADKRNLSLLSDDAALSEMGVNETTRRILLAGIPQTQHVCADQGELFWESRKTWFFKPAAGFGSRATYRGDKLTKRVFGEILQGNYIAQEIIPPSGHLTQVNGVEENMKVDVRAYVYDGQVQLLAARLYQGQTTNFRTPGGGFAPVFIT